MPYRRPLSSPAAPVPGPRWASGTVVERLPWWFIVETMFATFAIGSLLLDVKHKTKLIRQSRAEASANKHGK